LDASAISVFVRSASFAGAKKIKSPYLIDQCAIKFRKLQIAWSVLCGLACVLLIVLWVRSYRHFDELDVQLIRTQALSLENKGDILLFRENKGDILLFRNVERPLYPIRISALPFPRFHLQASGQE